MSSVASILTGTPAVVASSLIPGGGGGGVSSLNALSGALSLTSTGGSVTIAPAGSSIDLSVVPGLPAPGALTQLGTFSSLGQLLTSTPFTCPADGWYLIICDVVANGPGAVWNAGSTSFTYYVEKDNIADVPSYMTQMAQLPGGNIYAPQSLRYYNSGDVITPFVIQTGAPSLGSGGGITMYIQQLFA